MKLLITAPDFQNAHAGGVVAYYRKLRSYFSTQPDYFVLGRRAGSLRAWQQPLRLLKDYWKFFISLRRQAHDLVIVNPSLDMRSTIRDSVSLLLAKLMNKHVIVFIRGWNPKHERLINAYGRFFFRFVYGRADAVIVLAERFRDVLKEWGLQMPIYVESTAVDEDTFAVAPHCRQSSSVFGNSNLRLLFLSRLVKTKGIYLAIEAFRILQLNYPGASLMIAGDGPELCKAKANVEINDIKNVEFIGYVNGPEKRRIYERADIFLLPTQYGEGMSNAVLEAMGSGLPVVTRPVGGVTDFFKNGEMGFATSSESPEVFADFLLTLAKDESLRERISANNRNFARKYFSASSAATRLEAICTNVVQNKNHPEKREWYEI